MRDHWSLPPEEAWRYTGPDWLLDGGKEPDLKGKRKYPGEEDRGRGGDGGRKGRDAVDPQRSGWSRPAAGWTKINVDGSYAEGTGKAGIGIIARDHKGVTIFTSWRALFGCTGAEEAEARACIEGLRLATQWSHGPVVLESDCARMVKALRAADTDKSDICFLIAEAREFGSTLPEWRVSKVKREDNCVAHELAQLARHNTSTAVWLN
ncbi:hypothetical protein U9M48_006105 [Paspalum notatum var. saurae]|uniref:RNase H type-1 domain-containing protein n=1 Tax=Paspalum notatum var. saurae TaxID=547442 RepID=A0AAQ3PRI8_PASNO